MPKIIPDLELAPYIMHCQFSSSENEHGLLQRSLVWVLGTVIGEYRGVREFRCELAPSLFLKEKNGLIL